MTAPRKKLIEVALPLDAINKASAREKSIRHGHPSTLHLWWARRPLAAARAVIFAQMADDPSEYADELLADPATRRKAEEELQERLAAWQVKRARTDEAADTESLVGEAADADRAVGETADTEPAVGEAAGAEPAIGEAAGAEPTLEEAAADIERGRLFSLLEELVTWENTTNEAVLTRAREEIRRSWRRTCQRHADDAGAANLFDPDRLPAFHDPFAGGGYSSGSAAPRTGGPRQRFEPGGGLDQQGDDRDSAKVCGSRAGEPAGAGGRLAARADLEGGARAGGGRALLWRVDARGGGAAHRAFVSEG